jgi:REP element-mobilizing transposase RayT
MRMAAHVWNLRSARSFRVLRRCFIGGAGRFGTRIVQFSIQGDHIHLLVESPNQTALSRAIKGFSVRVARRMNGLMSRQGRVIANRYHAHLLRTPTEVRRAIAYIASNARRHAAQRGDRLRASWIDPFSWMGPPLPAPCSWLVRTAARAGP